MGSNEHAHLARKRKKVETRFGVARRNLAFIRLRLRGLSGATDEFLLATIV